MRPLHLREWPLFHTLWKVGHGTAWDLLQALADEHVADRHSVRAMLQNLEGAGYVRSERHEELDARGDRVERSVYFPVVEPETAIRLAWPELYELMLDDGKYLDLFREIVAAEP